MALTSKRTMNKEDEETVRKLEPHVKKENMKMAKKLNVDNMSRRTLVGHLNSMELPETKASEFDDNHIRQILIDFAPDLFFGSWGSN
jgi:hypothetical protein